jgi:hypothetical protein
MSSGMPFDVNKALWYLLRLDQSPECLIITNVCIGIILGPTALGLVWYIVFVLLYEIIMMIATNGGRTSFLGNPFSRMGYVVAGLFGWILGRTINSKVLEFDFNLPIRN